MPSQGVLVRQRVGAAIVATARAHAHFVGERLETRLAAVVEVGESESQPVELPDCTLFQHLLARHLEACLEALKEADAEHGASRFAVPDARERRDRLAHELYVSLRDLRAGFAGVFGRTEGGRLLGLRGSTARRPAALLRQARILVERLRRPMAPVLAECCPAECQGPFPRLVHLPGFEAECVRTADRLQAEIDRLEDARAEVERAVERHRRLGAARSEALEACDRAVRGTGRVLQGFYLLAGSPELARRVRFDVKGNLTAKGGV